MDKKLMQEDFKKAIEFITLIDGLKNIFRRTKIIGNIRFENDAEHSWHVSIMACTLCGFFGDCGISVERVVKMLLLHDIVELYAGDTYCYDDAAGADKLEREMAAAEKIFGFLPAPLSEEFRSLWLEFDGEETPDAIFASIMDKVQPVILNYNNQGESWLSNGISKTQVLNRIRLPLEKGPSVLRDYLFDIVDKSVEMGWLKDL